MPPRRPLAWIPLLCALSLAACATPAPVLVRLAMPPALRSCREAPTPPELTGDADLAYWILDLADAGQDCRDTLRRLIEALPPLSAEPGGV